MRSSRRFYIKLKQLYEEVNYLDKAEILSLYNSLIIKSIYDNKETEKEEITGL